MTRTIMQTSASESSDESAFTPTFTLLLHTICFLLTGAYGTPFDLKLGSYLFLLSLRTYKSLVLAYNPLHPSPVLFGPHIPARSPLI